MKACERLPLRFGYKFGCDRLQSGDINLAGNVARPLRGGGPVGAASCLRDPSRRLSRSAVVSDNRLRTPRRLADVAGWEASAAGGWKNLAQQIGMGRKILHRKMPKR